MQARGKAIQERDRRREHDTEGMERSVGRAGMMQASQDASPVLSCNPAA